MRELTPWQRVVRAVLALCAVQAVGITGYMLIEGWDLQRAFFFTVITVTTIGYGDYGLSRDGELFTSVVILGALGVFTFSLGQIVEGIASQDFMRRRMMERTIRGLREHVVIAGLGRVGRVIADQLEEAGVAFVVIDPNVERVASARARGWLALEGDATNDDVLRAGAIENAQALVCTAPTDAMNIVITLSAHAIAPNLRIISRGEDPDAIRKLERAGASKIVSPIHTGANRIVDVVLKPHLAELLDTGHSGARSVEMAEIPITPRMSTAWHSIVECGKAHPSVAFVAVRHPDGTMSFRLRPNERLNDGDVLLVAGEQEKVCAMALEAREQRMAA